MPGPVSETLIFTELGCVRGRRRRSCTNKGIEGKFRQFFVGQKIQSQSHFLKTRGPEPADFRETEIYVAGLELHAKFAGIKYAEAQKIQNVALQALSVGVHVAQDFPLSIVQTAQLLTLQKLDSPEIPVREELAFVEQYLRIQRLRFGSSFRASVDADPETHDALVPTLILQPLVENAVRHGVLARARGGALSVSICRRDDVLVMTVEDDGPGLGDGSAHPYGVGFKNTAERLAALYGEDAHMLVGPRPCGRGFVVVVFLPFREAPGMPAKPARVAVAL